jgi:hypothetical protein
MMCGVGALVTLELPADSPVRDLPWIVTIGPLSDDEDWDAVVCGPYERAHALAIAEELVADEQLMAVVEPVTPHVSIEVIRQEIAAARAAAVDLSAPEEDDDDTDSDLEAEYPDEDDEADDEADDDEEPEEHPGPPTPEEVRAGVARVAARLLAETLSEG